MKKFYLGALTLCSFLGYAQEVVWQKDIKSSTQDFLLQVTTTIDQQYLVSGSSIQSKKLSTESKQNNGYDFHLVKLDQQGKEVWEKYFSGQNHDFLSATVNTQEGGFLLAGTSYSGKGLDKKKNPKEDLTFGSSESMNSGMNCGRKPLAVLLMKKRDLWFKLRI